LTKEKGSRKEWKTLSHPAEMQEEDYSQTAAAEDSRIGAVSDSSIADGKICIPVTMRLKQRKMDGKRLYASQS
jgi:hypothetical protein